MKLHRNFLAATLIFVSITAYALDPTATKYTAAECQGSYMPYDFDVKPVKAPDSLEVVMINHVGRHGSRFLSSSKKLDLLRNTLAEARTMNALTAAGKRLSDLADRINAYTAGRWGALDSLGEEEQTQLATRMAQTFPGLFAKARVQAYSSWSPRCIMSMYSFVHQLSRLDNKLEVNTTSGRSQSSLLRPFDDDPYYKEYAATKAWEDPVKVLSDQVLTTTPLDRIFTKGFIPQDISAFLDAEYAVVASTAALGWPVALADYFTSAEYNALWAVDNLRQYLRYSASTLTTCTSEMAGPLLLNLINTFDNYLEHPETAANVVLRFGHAETLMPLLALIHLPGCYYMTNHFDTVALHWRNFYVVPMAANLRLVLLKHVKTGEYYLRADLNEEPVPLVPGRTALYTPWPTAREYLSRCLPLLLQP
ncbi:MAG: hypothetical protein HUK14_00460 [Muribaculaceae bacterium]|nr:hypothetical protein [Muribaculaceae bacterium]